MLTFNVKIHSLRTVEWSAFRDVKVDYNAISYEVQTSDIIHIAVNLFGKPLQTRKIDY